MNDYLKRALAWSIAIAAVWGTVTWAKGYHSPWASPSLSSVMPTAKGCGEKCHD